MKENFWINKNVFVTGATGFLGSWLVNALIKRKANVTVLLRDRLANSALVLSGDIRKINIVKGDLENQYLLERSLNEYEIDTCFHIGAQTIVRTANRNPISTFDSNIKGTWNVLEACRRNELIKSVVVASSDKAYGTQEKLPYTEDQPLMGRHPYDVSKSCMDLISQSYFKTYGLPVGIARCGNLYGGGDLNFNRLIPGTIQSVYFKKRPIIRSDGEFVRDYFYVKDVIPGYLALAEEISGGKYQGEAFNFSIRNQVRVVDIVNLIIKLMKSKLKPEILNIAKSEIRYQYLSTEKAEKLLGWRAKCNLKDGLGETINWYKKFLKGVY